MIRFFQHITHILQCCNQGSYSTVCVCVCVCVRAYVRACVRACVRVCVLCRQRTIDTSVNSATVVVMSNIVPV